jgi:colanic acid biosynthesis glycosyl transferase WcaI
MRLLFVNQYYPPDVAASAYLLGELSEDLARNHDVWVISGKPSYNAEASTFSPEGVHLVRAWSTTFSRRGMAGRLANYLTFFLTAFVRAMTVPRPDAVVALTDPPVIGLIGLAAARRYRAPFVYVCQDIFPDVGIALGRVDHPLAVRAWRGLNRVLRRGATRIVAIGRDMREKLVEEGVPASKIAVINNWANEAVPDASEVEATRATMGWEDRYVVMHGGNVGLAQNLDTVLSAAERVRDHERIQREAERAGLTNVRFIPYRPKDEARAVLAAADLHLISLAPGLRGAVVPSKVYGILALGRPFVAAVEPRSEVDLIIGETGAGLRVDPGDGDGMAEAIQRFADAAAETLRARQLGREAFQARFTRRQAADAYEALLRQVVAPAAGYEVAR